MAITKETLADQVYKILKKEILEEIIPGGTKITLKNLQDKFELSTTPLREAMNRLSGEGLLIHTTNVGAHVIELNAKDVEELYQMSVILESAAMELAYTHNANELKKVVTDCIDQQKDLLNAKNIDGFHQASDDFHDLFFHYADNERLYEASKRYRNQISILVNRYQQSQAVNEQVLKEHEEIAEAIINSDLNKAIDLFKAHLIIGKKSMLKNIQ